MSNVNYFKVAELPIVDTVPEGATVLAYNDGRLLRVNGEKVGSGGKVVKIKQDGYDDAVAGIAPAAAQGLTFTCDTPYEEIVQMILDGKNFSIKFYGYQSGMLMIGTLHSVIYDYSSDVPFIQAVGEIITLDITADGVSIAK